MSKGTVNRAILVGFVGNDPKCTKADTYSVCHLNISTIEKTGSKKMGTQKEETEWHSVNLFGNLADFVDQWVRKGDKVYIEGKYKISRYKDESGLEKIHPQIIADRIEIVRYKGNEERLPNQPQAQETQPLIDDVPF